MIKYEKLLICVKAPYYYYTHGGTFADTRPFLGDIALYYAIAYSLGLGLKPTLKDERINVLKNAKFLVSVGKPRVFKTKKLMIVGSSFEESIKLLSIILYRRGGSMLYKNIRKIKAIDVGSEFEAYIFYFEDISLPKKFAVRFGVGREGVLEIERVPPNDNDKIWLNLFTLNAIGLEMYLHEIDEKRLTTEVINKYYTIIKEVKVKDFLKILAKLRK